MKLPVQHFSFLFFLFTSTVGWCQQESAVDSLQRFMLNTRNESYKNSSESFSNSWSSFSEEHKQLIGQHLKAIKRRGLYNGDFLSLYLSSVISASKPENSGQTIAFLQTVQQSIVSDKPSDIIRFLNNARTFFDTHAVYLKPFQKVYVQDDEYTFAYRTPPSEDVIPAADTTQMNGVSFAPLDGAVIKFSRATLILATPYDSIKIENTKGDYSLTRSLFQNEGGTIDWSCIGVPSGEIVYTLGRYQYNPAAPVLRVKNGKLTYPKKLKEPLEGSFEFKSEKHVAGQEIYPQFTSASNQIQVSDLGMPQGVEYVGGFSLRGKDIRTHSLQGNSYQLTWKENERRFKMVGKGLRVSDSLLYSDDAFFTLYHGQDSIFHPSMDISYYPAQKKLIMVAGKDKYRKAPIQSSLFQMDFNADEMDWFIEQDSVTFSISGSGGVAPMIIESDHYFHAEDFRFAQGYGFRFHPLYLVVRYSRKVNQTEFYTNELVPDSRSDYETVVMAAKFLAGKGFIELYDDGKIKVNERAFLWVDANDRKADYDNIKIQSYYSKGPNATLNLKTNRMKVRGVEGFNVSDSLNVKFEPLNQTIQLTPNRGLLMDGTVNVGEFEVHGTGMEFDYKAFLVNINQIDSIRINIQEGTRRKRVDNTLVSASAMLAKSENREVANNTNEAKNIPQRGTKGTVFINRPNNKAGLEKVDNYPRFKSEGEEVIYFDRPSILNGVYDRSLYFMVPPFTVDSLQSQKKSQVNFKGKFYSSGMFSDFDETLTTMPDQSVGFTHDTPKTGYEVYKKEGKFTGQLSLSGKGIRGKGTIDYLTTTLQSDDFIFYVDSVATNGPSGKIEEGLIGRTNFPSVVFKKYKMRWIPKFEKMTLTNDPKDPFVLYKGKGVLLGSLTISKSGVSGEGRMKLPGAELASREIHLRTKEFEVHNARFRMLSDNPKIPAMDGKRVTLFFDLVQQKCSISPEIAGTPCIAFPFAQFRTSVTEAVWDLKTKKVTMDAKGNLENSYFISTKKELDSLRFMAARAEYDISKKQLKMSGIPYIVVADSKITPKNKELTISAGAAFGHFKNATLVIDTLNGYHTLTKGDLNIVSRNKFTGSANYKFVNVKKDSFFIVFDEFDLVPLEGAKAKGKHKEVPMQTHGTGIVSDEQRMMLNSKFQFKGKASMYASRPMLELEGFIRILYDDQIHSEWLHYHSMGTETNFYFSYDDALTEENVHPDAGLFLSSKYSLYGTCMRSKKELDDVGLFVPSGVFYFDDEASKLRIEDTLKVAGKKLSGSVFSFDEKKNLYHVEGPIRFFAPSREVKLTGAGSGDYDDNKHELNLNTLLVWDLKIPPVVWLTMEKNLSETLREVSLDDGYGDRTQLLYKVANMMPEKMAKLYEQQSLKEETPLNKFETLAKPLVLSNVNLRWSESAKAFYSVGPIGISHINKTNINASMEGYLEIKMTDNEEVETDLFIKASSNTWYYISQINGHVLLYSSNSNFNDEVAKRATAAGTRGGDITIGLLTEQEVQDFVNHFRKDYNNMESPYNLMGEMEKLTAPEPLAKEADKEEKTTTNEKPTQEATPKKEKQPVHKTTEQPKTNDPKEKKKEDDGF